MRLSLTPHPDHPSAAISGVDVVVLLSADDELVLRYTATGDVRRLRLPEAATPARTDELWKTTCFEAFLWPSADVDYYELNFSPSTQWASYHFVQHRTGMSPASGMAEPVIQAQLGDGAYELTASIVLPHSAQWRIKPCAVIEDVDGRLSYWSIGHPAGKADFHDSRDYRLVLPQAELS
jgi:hypothetical protein